MADARDFDGTSLSAAHAQKFWDDRGEEEAVLRDRAAQDQVTSSTVTAPPVGPVVGDRYIVPSGATGSWTGLDESIVMWDGGTWVEISAVEGMTAYVDSLGKQQIFDGAAWVDFGVGADGCIVHDVAGIVFVGGRTLAQIDGGAWGGAEIVLFTGPSGTPAAAGSDLCDEGDLVEYFEFVEGAPKHWRVVAKNVGGFPASGAAAVAALVPFTLYAPLVDGVDNVKMCTWDGASLTPTLSVILTKDLVRVSSTVSFTEGMLWTYRGTPPTGTLHKTGDLGALGAGIGLKFDGPTIMDIDFVELLGDKAETGLHRVDDEIRVATEDLVEKATLATEDRVMLADSEDSWDKKYVGYQHILPKSVQVEGANNADTSSTSMVLIEGAGATEKMEVEPGNGIWDIIMNLACQATAGAETIVVTLEDDGGPLTDTQEHTFAAAGVPVNITVIGKSDLSSGGKIYGKFKSVGGTGVRVTTRIMQVRQVRP